MERRPSLDGRRPALLTSLHGSSNGAAVQSASILNAELFIGEPSTCLDVCILALLLLLLLCLCNGCNTEHSNNCKQFKHCHPR
jgi:hypothetical protein